MKTIMNQNVINKYLDGFSCIEIAKEYNCHRTTVQLHLKKNNIKLRNKMSSKRTYNRKFFKYYSAKSCYWAGFIAADGCVYSNKDAINITLSKKDKSHLEKFIEDIKSNHNIHHYKDVVHLTIYGLDFINDFAENYGFGPRKTFKLKFPRKIPNKYIHHFIRGFFDGDGSIYKHSQANIMNLDFLGTRDIMYYIGEHFKNNLNIYIRNQYRLPKIRKVKNIYNLRYSGNNAKKILKYLYKYSGNSKLDRKHKKYLEFI